MANFTMRTVRGQPRRTKIVCTLGPASSSPEMVRKLIFAGMNVARINCSHGSHEQFRATYATVRAAAAETGRIVGVLFDLCGPKMRIREVEGGGAITLVPGERVTLSRGEAHCTAARLTSIYAALVDDVNVGDPVYLDDGNFRLRVVERTPDEAVCTVEVGGKLTGRKGINLPGSIVSAPALSDKDRDDARLAAELGADFVALSFVREPAHVKDLRDLLVAAGSRAKIISKIEKPQALDKLDAIIAASDGAMVARGDLGVEMPVEQVPGIQKRIILACRRALKPVIVATQMMESMIHSPRPTRAEVSDVANAIEDGCDACMLSAETASGEYPVEAVSTMAEAAIQAEKALAELQTKGEFVAGTLGDPLRKAMAESAVAVAAAVSAKFIVVRTETGATARYLSELHSTCPVIAAHPDEAVLRSHALDWGVLPVRTSKAAGTASSADSIAHGVVPGQTLTMEQELRRLARELFDQGLGMPSDTVVIVAHYPWGEHAAPNFLRVMRVSEAVG